MASGEWQVGHHAEATRPKGHIAGRKWHRWSAGGARRGHVAKGHAAERAHVGAHVGATRKVGNRGDSDDS